jgi:hypothetical protein
MPHLKSNSLWPYLNTLAIIFFLCLFLWSYLQTEISTWAYANQINNIEQLCLDSSEKSTLKFYKILWYNKSLESAAVYCIYDQQEKNSRLEISKNQEWRITYSTKLNKERSLYWPIYI